MKKLKPAIAALQAAIRKEQENAQIASLFSGLGANAAATSAGAVPGAGASAATPAPVALPPPPQAARSAAAAALQPIMKRATPNAPSGAGQIWSAPALALEGGRSASRPDSSSSSSSSDGLANAVARLEARPAPSERAWGIALAAGVAAKMVGANMAGDATVKASSAAAAAGAAAGASGAAGVACRESEAAHSDGTMIGANGPGGVALENNAKFVPRMESGSHAGMIALGANCHALP